MKKLMLAAAIVCAAAMTQAATTNWKYSITGALKAGYTGNGTSSAAMSGQTVYLFDLGSYTQQNLIDALVANQAFDISSKAIKDSSSKIVSLQTNASGMNTTGTTFASEDYTVGTKYSFWAATIVDSDKDGKADYVFVSGTLADKQAQDASKTTPLATAVGTSTNLRSGTTFASGGWYAVAAPEPTSGLLLLLGVAGLALKRRRA